MTPAKLIQWRENLGWSQTDAADALGISFRAYQYLEAAVTSRGRPIKFIPKLTELACAELARREQSASPRAPGSGSRSRARLSDCHAIAVAVFAYLYQ